MKIGEYVFGSSNSFIT